MFQRHRTSAAVPRLKARPSSPNVATTDDGPSRLPQTPLTRRLDRGLGGLSQFRAARLYTSERSYLALGDVRLQEVREPTAGHAVRAESTAARNELEGSPSDVAANAIEHDVDAASVQFSPYIHAKSATTNLGRQ
jgi:hypothetical protein